MYDVTHSSASGCPCVVMDDTLFAPSKFARIHGRASSLSSADQAPVRFDIFLATDNTCMFYVKKAIYVSS